LKGGSSTEIIGIVAGIFTALSLLPQLIKVIQNKKAEDISFFFLSVLFVGLGLWVWYGIRREDLPIVLTNTVSLFINALLLVIGIRYKRNANGK
jgi:MtN3 and saliva related transmembrane protein